MFYFPVHCVCFKILETLVIPWENDYRNYNKRLLINKKYISAFINYYFAFIEKKSSYNANGTFYNFFFRLFS